MSSKGDGEGLPTSVSEFFRGDGKDDSLPLPFASRTTPIQGEAEGHELSGHIAPFLRLTGEWEVMETSSHGYPAVLRTKSRDSAVAATLQTPHPNATYESAILGYGSEVGTFGIGMKLRAKEITETFPGGLPCYAESCTVDSLRPVLTPETGETPVAILVDRSVTRPQGPPVYSPYSTAYIWHAEPGHKPQQVLRRLKLDTFRTLITRYETAAESIRKPFHPDINQVAKRPKGRNPEKGRKLMQLVRERLE